MLVRHPPALRTAREMTGQLSVIRQAKICRRLKSDPLWPEMKRRTAKLPAESLKIRLLLFHEQQPMRYRRSENIGIQQHYYSHNGT